MKGFGTNFKNIAICVKFRRFKIKTNQKKISAKSKSNNFAKMEYHEMIVNQGFSHIGQQIFELLDFEDLKLCRLICKSWTTFIDKNPKWNKILLKMAKKKLLLTIHYYTDLDNWTYVSIFSPQC